MRFERHEEQKQQAASSDPERSRLISIVDDDESVRESLSSLLRSVGYETREFASGEAFLQSPWPAQAACIVTDLRMPGMNGIDLHVALSRSGIRVPTILISAHEDTSVRASAARAGVSAVLAKPFSEQALLDAIRASLKKQ